MKKRNQLLEEIKKYTDKYYYERYFKYNDFNEEQLEEILESFKNGLSIDEIKTFAKPQFSARVMRISRAFSYIKRLNVLIKEYNLLNQPQKEQIKHGLMKGLKLSEIKMYAKPYFSAEQMSEIKKGFENGLSKEKIKIYADPKYDETEMYFARLGFEEGFSVNEVKLYLNIQEDYDLIFEIRRFIKKLKKENISEADIIKIVKPFVDNKTSYKIIENIISILEEDKIFIKKIYLFANPKFNSEQLEIIKESIKEGFENEQIKVFAKPEFSADVMNIIKKYYKKYNLTPKEAKLLILSKFKLSIEQIREKIKSKDYSL